VNISFLKFIRNIIKYKNIDKYTLNGEILTLNKNINRFHSNDISNLEKLALDLIDEKHGKE